MKYASYVIFLVSAALFLCTSVTLNALQMMISAKMPATLVQSTFVAQYITLLVMGLISIFKVKSNVNYLVTALMLILVLFTVNFIMQEVIYAHHGFFSLPETFGP